MNLFMLPSLIPFGDLTRLDLRPGDAVVLSAHRRIPPDAHERLQAMWHTNFPGTKCLVLEDIDLVGVLGQ